MLSYFFLGRHSFAAIFAVATFAFLLFYCQSTHQFPQSSGDVTLLFPKHSTTLDWHNQKALSFDDYHTDIVALNLGTSSTNLGPQISTLRELESDFLELPGINQVILPPLDTTHTLDPFGLISDSGSVRLLLKIENQLPESQKNQLNARINELLKDYAVLNPSRAGSFFTAREVSNAVEHETKRVTPWVIGLLAATLMLMFSSIRIGCLVIGVALLAVGTVILTYSAMGFALGPITQLAPPFLLAIGAAFNVHVVGRLQQCPISQRAETIRELRHSISLAALTTGVSLLSLGFLDVTGVTRFAALSSSGVFLSAVYALYILPHFLPKDLSPPTTTIRWPIVILTKSRALPLIGSTVAMSLVLLAGVGRLEIDTDPLEFLPKDSPALTQISSTNQQFPGNHYLSLVMLKCSEPLPGFNEFRLDSMVGAIEKIPGVERVISPLDLELTPGSRSTSAQSFQQFRHPRAPTDSSETTTPDKLHLLIETESEGTDLIRIKDRIYAIVTTNKAAVATYEFGITSHELIMAEQTIQITRGLIRSLSTTLAFVFIALLVIFKKLKIALIGLVPNILPLFGVFGVLGYTTRHLNFGSCLVATAALGIAVDNTFHFLLCWRIRSQQNQSAALSIRQTLIETTRPFVTTTGTLVLSFSAMLSAKSLPVQHFGAFLGTTLVFGLFADLVILPKLLETFCQCEPFLKKS